MRENCIEWIETYSKKLINKIKAISEENPTVVEIIKENEDGSICVHAPLQFLKISPKRTYNLSEERRQQLRENFEKVREGKCGKTSS